MCLGTGWEGSPGGVSVLGGRSPRGVSLCWVGGVPGGCLCAGCEESPGGVSVLGGRSL